MVPCRFCNVKSEIVEIYPITLNRQSIKFGQELVWLNHEIYVAQSLYLAPI